MGRGPRALGFGLSSCWLPVSHFGAVASQQGQEHERKSANMWRFLDLGSGSAWSCLPVNVALARWSPTVKVKFQWGGEEELHHPPNLVHGCVVTSIGEGVENGERFILLTYAQRTWFPYLGLGSHEWGFQTAPEALGVLVGRNRKCKYIQIHR